MILLFQIEINKSDFFKRTLNRRIVWGIILIPHTIRRFKVEIDPSTDCRRIARSCLAFRNVEGRHPHKQL